jgi:TetR/AcrR family transcriptional regulator, cholesterol catabolism regulator
MEEQEIHEKILAGAEELFMKYGVRSISMDDISRHLSVSKKTLYQHFADKDELVTLVSKAHLDRTRQEHNNMREESRDPIEELAKISVCMRKDMEALNPALLFDIQKYHPKAWKVWLEFKNKFIYDSVVRNLTQGIKDGYIRAEVNPDIMALMRIELVQMAFNNEIFPSSKFKLIEVQGQIFDHFVYGLVTEKGRKLYQKYKQNILTLDKTTTHL